MPAALSPPAAGRHGIRDEGCDRFELVDVDVLECPRCRGTMKIIAKITDPKVIRRFLAAIDLPTEAPRIGWDDELYAEPSANTDMDGAC